MQRLYRITTYRREEEFHTRPINDFVRLAQSFDADLRVSSIRRRATRPGRPEPWYHAGGADPKLMFRMFFLKPGVRRVSPREYLTIRGRGHDAGEAVDALARFVTDGLPVTSARAALLERTWREAGVWRLPDAYTRRNGRACEPKRKI